MCWKQAVLGLLTITAACDAGADDAANAANAPNAPSAAVEASAVEPPTRPVAPLSATTVTSSRPTLRWATTAPVVVQVCRERACTHVVEQRFAHGGAMRPARALAAGVYFWRVACLHGGHAAPWSAVWEFRVPARPQAVAVDSSGGIFLDVNGDGFADLAERTLNDNLPEYDLDVYLGGAGGLAPTAATSLRLPGDVNNGVLQGYGVGAVGDLNGDGYGEVAIGNEGVAKVYAGSAAGLVTTPRSLTAADANPYQFAMSLAAGGDVDGDGYGEFVVADSNQRVWIYRGGPDGVADAPSWEISRIDGENINTIFVGAADFDGDGYSDIAVNEYQGGANRWLRIVPGGPDGLADPASVPTRPGVATFGAVGDFDADGYPDLLSWDRFTELNLFPGGPAGPGATPAQVIDVDAASFTAHTGDVNGDGRDDVLVTRVDSSPDSFYFTIDRVDVHLAGATGVAATAAMTLEEEAYVGDIENNFGEPQTLADFDRDGRLDVALSAAPPYPTPYFDDRPSYFFVFPGAAAGVSTTANPAVSGIPGFGRNLAAGPR
jgi:hypothetical protein